LRGGPLKASDFLRVLDRQTPMFLGDPNGRRHGVK
jgi:hypothetical protein